jgi:SAM-dependent methyltransferase
MDPAMRLLPWRVRAFVSNTWPLFYHLAANISKQRRSESYWDARLAETWDRRDWPSKNEIIASSVSLEDRILDIACGNGGILRHLKAHGYRNVEGLEISRYAVGRLRNEGIEMHHGSVPTLPLPDGRYDVVIASQVLEHVIRRDRFAREIARILKPEGSAFIFVPNDCLGPIDEPEHVAKYTAATLSRFLRKHFELTSIEVITDANHSITILFAKVRKKRTPACVQG